MTRRIAFILIALFIIPLSSCANKAVQEVKDMPSGVYELDKSHSSLHFRVKHMGLSNYTAQFTKFKANLSFDAKNPETSGLQVAINSNSVKTDYPFPKKKNFDKFISENENWLNSKKYPEIRFRSTSIRKTGSTKAIMMGDLSMLGVTKPAMFNVEFNGSYKNKPHAGVPALGFSATAKIKRSEWGFGAFVPAISDEVEIIIETEFHKK
jgi:polyisoprenoid-binding protein YceI